MQLSQLIEAVVSATRKTSVACKSLHQLHTKVIFQNKQRKTIVKTEIWRAGACGTFTPVCQFQTSRERQYAGTIGTVLVPSDGHFQCKNINLSLKYTEAILSNNTRKLLWFDITKMLTAV